MPLVLGLLLALSASSRAQTIDLKQMKADAAQGGSVAARPVELPPSVVLKSDNPPPPNIDEIDHTQENPAMDGEDDETAAQKNRAGLTVAHIKPHLEVEWATSHGKAWISKALIRFSVDQRMSITSLYSEASCPYRATKEHETGHWNDNKAFLDDEAAGLKQDLIGLGLPTQDRPVAEGQTDDVAGRIAAAIKTHQKSFTARARQAKAVRDDPDAYKKNDYSKCLPPHTKANEWKTQGP